MAHKATTWAWDVEGLSIPQKFLLVALADMADEAFSCFPGQALLAKMTGAKSKRSVVNNLAALEDLGYIRRERRNRSDGSRTSDRFVMVVGHQHPLSASDAPGGVVHEVQGLSASDDVSKVHLTTGQGARDALEENPQRNPQKEPPASTPVVPTGDELFERAWLSWPKKSEKKLSRERFLRVLPSRPSLVDEIELFGRAYAETTDVQFVPALAVWINRERWTDPPPRARGAGRPNTIDTARSAFDLLQSRDAAQQKAISA